MKLKNKQTGEIKEVIVGGYPVSGKTKMWECSEMDANEETGYKSLGTYTSLAELNKEWEDMPEEPKEYWYIESDGSIIQNHKPTYINHLLDGLKSIGNYFETREEAEKAVEKLKAWKRLEDGGITFKNWTINQTGTIDCFATWGDNIPPSRKNPTLLEDLDLLFGGEE